MKKITDDSQITLGNHGSYNLYKDPKRLAFVLSRYKFASKMIGRNKHILELGCSEGIGVPFFAEFALSYKGVDSDLSAIEIAKKNWTNNKIQFIEDDFLGKNYGVFDSVISLDVVEHVDETMEKVFFDTIYNNLGEDGIGIVGTPNITSSPYASKESQIGHVNLFNGEKLRSAMERIFYNVFIFGMNDEIVHTGFLPMAHYLFCIGCYKKL